MSKKPSVTYSDVSRSQSPSIVMICSCGNTMQFHSPMSMWNNQHKSSFDGSQIYDVTKRSTKRKKKSNKSDTDSETSIYDLPEKLSTSQSTEENKEANRSVRYQSVRNKKKYVKLLEGDDTDRATSNKQEEENDSSPFVNSYPKALQNLAEIPILHLQVDIEIESGKATSSVPQNANSYPTALQNLAELPVRQVDIEIEIENGKATSSLPQNANSYPKARQNLAELPVRQSSDTLTRKL